MKVVIIGGHLSPALAVIEELKKKNEILFIGRKKTFEGDEAESLEYRIIKRLNIPFASISTGRFQRKFTKYTILSFLKLPAGFINSFRILNRFKPDIVLGFGGYLQIPIIFASIIQNIPVVIHEQTLEAGLSNKICSFFARKICISWKSSRNFFPKEKTILTGNPIRKRFLTKAKAETQKIKLERNRHPLVYVTGGSSGSHFVNVLIEGCVAELLKNFRIIHQTGNAAEYNDFERLTALKDRLKKELRSRYILKKFIEDDSELLGIYQDAEIVISRAGINTVTELIFFKKPSILIPIPFSQKDEQNKNALFLKKLGLCEILDQNDASSEKFMNTFKKIEKRIRYFRIEESEYKKNIQRNASKKIVEVLEDEKKKK